MAEETEQPKFIRWMWKGGFTWVTIKWMVLWWVAVTFFLPMCLR